MISNYIPKYGLTVSTIFTYSITFAHAWLSLINYLFLFYSVDLGLVKTQPRDVVAAVV